MIDVICLQAGDSGDPWGWYAKGHVDKADFFAAFAEEFVDDALFGDYSEQQVRHIHARWVPKPPSCSYDVEFTECKPGRGAFAVTLLESGL